MKKARYRGIPCFFNPDTYEIMGRTWFYDKLINLLMWIDIEILGVEEFKIWMEDEK